MELFGYLGSLQRLVCCCGLNDFRYACGFFFVVISQKKKKEENVFFDVDNYFEAIKKESDYIITKISWIVFSSYSKETEQISLILLFNGVQRMIKLSHDPLQKRKG